MRQARGKNLSPGSAGLRRQMNRDVFGIVLGAHAELPFAADVVLVDPRRDRQDVDDAAETQVGTPARDVLVTLVVDLAVERPRNPKRFCRS